MDIDFLVNPEINKLRLTSAIQCAKDTGLLPKTAISVGLWDLDLDSSDFLKKISFHLEGHSQYRGDINLYALDIISVNWHSRYNDNGCEVAEKGPPSTDVRIHPPVHLETIMYEDRPTFYLYSKNSPPSDTTIVMVDGGPPSFYDCSSYRIMAHEWCTKQGHTLIFPQETLRGGYGYAHYKAGLGEMARGNLRQILAMVKDGLEKGLIPNADNIHLWGHSYGGFVAASLALRLDEFNPSFRFKSITVENPCMYCDEKPSYFSNFLKSQEDLEKPHLQWSREVSPLSYVHNPLSAPLLIITGSLDTRCEVASTDSYATALARHPNVAYLKHPAGHDDFVGDEDDLDVKFPILDGWIKGIPASVTPEQLTGKGIEIVFGKNLLLAPVQ